MRRGLSQRQPFSHFPPLTMAAPTMTDLDGLPTGVTSQGRKTREAPAQAELRPTCAGFPSLPDLRPYPSEILRAGSSR
jgi:hypothetical protein